MPKWGWEGERKEGRGREARKGAKVEMGEGKRRREGTLSRSRAWDEKGTRDRSGLRRTLTQLRLAQMLGQQVKMRPAC